MNKKHRQLFLEVVKEAVDQFEIEIHANCLMRNHYHLLVKTPQAKLTKISYLRFTEKEMMPGKWLFMEVGCGPKKSIQ